MNDTPNVKGHQILQRVAAQALDDDAYRQRLLDDPKSVLREAGLTVEDEVELTILEDTPTHVHLVLPARSPDEQELDIEEVDVRVMNVGIHF